MFVAADVSITEKGGDFPVAAIEKMVYKIHRNGFLKRILTSLFGKNIYRNEIKRFMTSFKIRK